MHPKDCNVNTIVILDHNGERLLGTISNLAFSIGGRVDCVVKVSDALFLLRTPAELEVPQEEDFHSHDDKLSGRMPRNITQLTKHAITRGFPDRVEFAYEGIDGVNMYHRYTWTIYQHDNGERSILNYQHTISRTRGRYAQEGV